MSAGKAGLDFVLKKQLLDTSYAVIGGLRTKSMVLNRKLVDTTNHGSNNWRQYKSGAGIKTMDVSGAGVFVDDTALDEIRDAFLSGIEVSFQLVDTDSGDTFTANFIVEGFDRAGSYDQEQTYSLTLKSSGAVVVS